MPDAAISDKRFVPFVFAVTGHRLLRDEDKVLLRAKLRSIFGEYHKAMPHTPLVLLSGLAGGADQLAAECALQTDVCLIAVLPMPLATYRDTMSRSAAESLDHLLAQASIVKLLPCGQRTEAEIASSEDVRDTCYDELGKYLASNCQALLALWDAAPSDKTGGTAKVVDYVLKGVEQSADASHGGEYPQTGIVYHLLTPRPDTQSAGAAGTLRLLMGKAKPGGIPGHTTITLKQIKGTSFARVQSSIERFNEIANLCRLKQGERYLVPGHFDLQQSAFMERIDAVCAHSDAVSRRAAGQRRRFLIAIVAAISVGTFWYSIADEVYKDELGLWLVLPIMISVALTLNWFARRARVEDLYLDARALSETLRVQYFWELACIRESAADHYLPHHTWEVDWVRCALRNILLFRELEAGRSCSPDTVNTILSLWIEDQSHWYLKRARQQHRLVKRGDSISKWTLLGGLVWSTLVPLTLLIMQHTTRFHEPVKAFLGRWEGWLHVPGVVFTVVAGAYRLWTDQSGFTEQSREYDRIGNYLVRQASFLAAHANDIPKMQEALVATGIATLEENARWLLLHRERHLEVVAG